MVIAKYTRKNSNLNPENPCEFTRGVPFGFSVSEFDGNNIYLGFSLCANGDSFDKDKARLIAFNRLQSKKYYIPVDFVETDRARDDILNNVLGRFVNKNNYYTFEPIVDDLLWTVRESVRRFKKSKDNRLD
jgi:hypothetical protein